MKKNLAIVTMAYDDSDYLRIWLDYWRAHLPDDQLYVLIHGENADLEAMAAAVNVVRVPRPAPYPEMEEDRWKYLSGFVSDLLGQYRVAVYSDVDEILVSDPRNRQTIVDRLCSAQAPVSHAMGLELIHRGDLEPDLDPGDAVLGQRDFFRATSFHSKPCIVTAPISWARGGHFHDKQGVRFLGGVFCIHLRFYDEKIFLERSERRRKTTQAPKELDQNPHRQWRTSNTAAQELLDKLRQTPVKPFAWAVLAHMRYRMWRRAASRPNENGFYRYPLFTYDYLHRLPPQFKALF